MACKAKTKFYLRYSYNKHCQSTGLSTSRFLSNIAVQDDSREQDQICLYNFMNIFVNICIHCKSIFGSKGKKTKLLALYIDYTL